MSNCHIILLSRDQIKSYKEVLISKLDGKVIIKRYDFFYKGILAKVPDLLS